MKKYFYLFLALIVFGCAKRMYENDQSPSGLRMIHDSQSATKKIYNDKPSMVSLRWTSKHKTTGNNSSDLECTGFILTHDEKSKNAPGERYLGILTAGSCLKDEDQKIKLSTDYQLKIQFSSTEFDPLISNKFTASLATLTSDTKPSHTIAFLKASYDDINTNFTRAVSSLVRRPIKNSLVTRLLENVKVSSYGRLEHPATATENLNPTIVPHSFVGEGSCKISSELVDLLNCEAHVGVRLSKYDRGAGVYLTSGSSEMIYGIVTNPAGENYDAVVVTGATEIKPFFPQVSSTKMSIADWIVSATGSSALFTDGIGSL